MKKIMNFFSKLSNNNTVLFCVSLLIACVLWFYVNGYYNPEDTININDIPVTVNFEGSIPDENGLTVLDHDDRSVDIKVTGPRVYLSTLRKDSVEVTVDMDAVTAAGSYSLPINIELPNSDKLQITEQSVYNVNFVFDKEATKNVPVEVVTVGSLKDDYMLGTVTVSPATVNLTGPATLLDTIEKIPVEVNVSPFTITQTVKKDIVIADKNGDEIANTRLVKDFDTVSVNLPVYKVKEVPVTVALVNSSGGSDEAIIKTEISPKTVRVAANEADLQEYNQLILGTIDTAQYDSASVINFDIISPSGITIIDDVSKVTVKLSFESFHTASFTIPSTKISFSNVPKGINPSASGSITVKLRGIPSQIDSLKSDAIRANVDMGTVTATDGSVTLPVTFTVNDIDNVGVIGKYTVNVNLNK